MMAASPLSYLVFLSLYFMHRHDAGMPSVPTLELYLCPDFPAHELHRPLVLRDRAYNDPFERLIDST